MPLTVSVARGHTFQDGVRFDTDDLNAAALPTVTIAGSVGSSDIAAGSVNSTHVKPGPIAYAAATGSANAYAVALDPAASALTAGLWCAFKANHTNTGAATLNVNSLGAVALRKQTDTALEAGDIRNGQVVWAVYDGTYWQLTSPEGLPRKTYGEAAGSTNAYTLALADVVPTLAALTGRVLLFKANAANTGACTLNVNSLGATSIKKLDGTDPSGGDIPSGKVIAVAYDGTNFQLLGGTSSAALPDVGTAGTYAYPTSVTVDAKGRVTSITAGTIGTFTTFTSTAAAVPASGAAVTEAHGLGSVPKIVQWVLVAIDVDCGYAIGDEVDIGSCVDANGFADDDTVPPFVAYRDATNVVLRRNATIVALYMPHKSTGAYTSVNTAKWTVKAYAAK